MRTISETEFQAVVQAALKSLPDELQPYLANCSVLIEDMPSPELIVEAELEPGPPPFGLYLGVPLTERTHDAPPLLPDRIYIFSAPLMEACETKAELQEEIAITVVHEIAHHFGLDEDELEALGYE